MTAMRVPPKKPHFFKPIQPGFKHGLKLPIGFLKYLKGTKNDHAVLRRAGKKWLVKLNGHRFEEGWEEFAEEHDLQSGNMLVFKHEGDMEFEVTIFDSNHCEREYAEYLHEQEQDAHTFEEKPNTRIMLSSKDFHHAEEAHIVNNTSKKFESQKAATHKLFCQSHVEFIVEPYFLSNGYFRLPKEFARENSVTNKKCGLIIRDGRERSWNFMLYTSCSQVYVGGRWGEFCVANDLKLEDRIRLEVVTIGEKPIWKFHGTTEFIGRIPSTSGGDGLPYFISTIKPYCISRHYLHLPLGFLKSNELMNRKCEMILKDEAQRSWSVWLGRIDANHFGITRGWKQFRAAKGLQVGDTYKFELIKYGKVPIAFFRHLIGSPSLQPEIKKNNSDDKRISDKGLHYQEQTDLRIKTSDALSPISRVSASTSTNDTNPHFISIIKPYTITHSILNLPMAFVKSNGLMNRREMIIVNEKRILWYVHLGLVGSHFVIKRRGWEPFMKANGVRVGDSYKFELIHNGTLPIAYFHCNYSGKDDKHHISD